MIERRTRIIGGLLVLLAAVPEAIPQTVRNGAPTRQVAPRKTGKSGNNGSSPATGTTPAAMPGLCFQAGVGWQRILLEPSGASATQSPHGSIGPEAGRSTSAAHAQSSTQQVYAAGCAGSLINQKALGAGVEKLTTLHGSQTIVTSLHGDLPYHAHGSAGPEPVGMLPGALPTYFAPETGSEAHLNQLGIRTFHAYTSSIKLRRLMRNAPDFRTRIQLQQLQTNPQPHKARASQKQKRLPAGRRSASEQTKPPHGDRIVTTGSQSRGVGP